MVQPTRRILAFAVGTADAQASSTVARPGTAIASKPARLRRSRLLMPTSMTGLSLHTEYDQNVVLVLHCQGKCCRVVAVVTVALTQIQSARAPAVSGLRKRTSLRLSALAPSAWLDLANPAVADSTRWPPASS